MVVDDVDARSFYVADLQDPDVAASTEELFEHLPVSKTVSPVNLIG